MDRKLLEKRHQMIALPSVRIRTTKGSGSGTILWSEYNEEDHGYPTYVLTNHHVVDSAIRVTKKWNSLRQKDVKRDILEQIEVHLFNYRWTQRAVGASTMKADIVAYEADQDLALVKFIAPEAQPVASIYAQDKEHELRVGMEVIAIGAGMGADPIQTEGILSQFGQEIDRKEYWAETAPIIFGNSGGGLFLKDTFELIGVPARVRVVPGFLSRSAVTHMGYAIPITRIYEFLDDNYYRFIYDDEFTEESEAEERERIREEGEE